MNFMRIVFLFAPFFVQWTLWAYPHREAYHQEIRDILSDPERFASQNASVVSYYAALLEDIGDVSLDQKVHLYELCDHLAPKDIRQKGHSARVTNLVAGCLESIKVPLTQKVNEILWRTSSEAPKYPEFKVRLTKFVASVAPDNRLDYLNNLDAQFMQNSEIKTDLNALCEILARTEGFFNKGKSSQLPTFFKIIHEFYKVCGEIPRSTFHLDSAQMSLEYEENQEEFLSIIREFSFQIPKDSGRYYNNFGGPPQYQRDFRILNYLRECTPEKRRPVFDVMVSLYPSIGPSQRVITLLNQGNFEETKSVLMLIQRFFSVLSEHKNQWVNFFETLIQLPGAEKEIVIRRISYMMDFSSKTSSFYISQNLIAFLNVVDDSEWVELHDLCLQLQPFLRFDNALACLVPIQAESRQKVVERFIQIEKTCIEKNKKYIENKNQIQFLFKKLDILYEKKYKELIEFIKNSDLKSNYNEYINIIIDLHFKFKNHLFEELNPIAIHLVFFITHCRNSSVLVDGMNFEDLKEIASTFNNLQETLTDSTSYIPIFDELRTIPADQRCRLLKLALSYPENRRSGDYIASFLKDISVYPKEEIDRLTQLTAPLLLKIRINGHLITEMLRELPSEHIQAIVSLVDDIQNLTPSGQFLTGFFKKLCKMPAQEITEIHENLKSLLPKIKSYRSTLHIFELIQGLEKEQQQKLVHFCDAFFNDIRVGYHAIATAWNEIPELDRSICFEKALELSQNSCDGFYIADLTIAFYRFSFKHEDASSSIQKFCDFVVSNKYGDTYKNNSDYTIEGLSRQNHRIRKHLYRHLCILPPVFFHDCLENLSRLESSSEEKFEKLIKNPIHISLFFLKKITNFKEGLYPFWKELLETCPNKCLAKELSDFIIKYHEYFELSVEDELVQMAIRVGTVLEDSQDPKNPYIVFQRLKKQREKGFDFATLNLKSQEIGGRNNRFNPAFFMKELPQFNLPFSKLPFYPSHFLDVFKRHLEMRVKKEPALKDHIQNTLGWSLEYIFRHCLAPGSSLQTYLKKIGHSHEKVPVIQARFIAIIHYLMTLSDDREECQVFSEMEESVLRMFVSILGCSHGKNDGINNYYLHVLPQKFRFSETNSEEDSASALSSKAFFCEHILEEVEKLFSGQNALMKELSHIEKGVEISQSSHQALYLRNAIGHLVGLHNELVFDGHTQHLYDALAEASQKELLEAFYRYLWGIIPLLAEKYDIDEKTITDQLEKIGALTAVPCSVEEG